MSKKKQILTLSVSMNSDNEVSLKGAIEKSFKLNNNRKRIFIYRKENLEKLFDINVKPTKHDKNVYKIDLENLNEGVIESVNEMNSKFGDIKIVGLYNDIGEIKTSTIILDSEKD